MKFTGNLIESLMATVERVEQGTFSDEPLFARPSCVEPLLMEPLLMEPFLMEPWLASALENTNNDSKFLGVA
jgi:hypothetical protein